MSASETWTGSDGAAWPGQWTARTVSGTGTSTIQTNRGRLTASGSASAQRVALLSGSDQADFDLVVSVGTGDASEQYNDIFYRIGTNAASGLPGSGYVLEIVPSSNEVGLWELSSGGAYTSLAVVTTAGVNNTTRRNFRIRVEGGHHQVKWWTVGSGEPGTWQIDITGETTYATGRFLLGQYNGGDATSRLVDFDDLVISDLIPATPSAPTVTTVDTDSVDIDFTPPGGADQMDLRWRRIFPGGIPGLTTQSSAPWHLHRIDQSTATTGTGNYTYRYNGTGVIVYVIDTGIRTTNTNFGGRATQPFEGDVSWTNEDNDGHGTECAGLVGSTTYGVAKNVSLVGLRVADDYTGDFINGIGLDDDNADYVAAYNYIRDNHPAGTPGIVTDSWTARAYTGPNARPAEAAALEAAIQEVIDMGVVVCVWGGNFDDDPWWVPAIMTDTIAVGGTDDTDAPFSVTPGVYASATGPFIDIFAPGEGTVTTGHESNTDTATPGAGTSSATPIVAGALALLLQQNPHMSPIRAKEVLQGQATAGVLTGIPGDTKNLFVNSLMTTSDWTIVQDYDPDVFGGLEPGTQYEFQIRQVVAGIPSDWSTSTLDFTEGEWQVFSDGLSTSTEGTVTGLTDGILYEFRVAAINAIGQGPYSASDTETPTSLTAPGAPTSLNATPGNAQVALTWTAPASNGGSAITDYIVQWRTTAGPGSWNTFSDGTSTTAAATVTGLTNGTSYDFQVAAVNAIGTGSYSSTDTDTPFTVPGAPTSIVSTPGSGQVALTWTAPGSNGGSAITDYIVQWRTTAGPGSWNTFSDGTSTTAAATVTGLTNGTSYDFQIAAVNAAGTGSYSSPDTETPSAGSGLTISTPIAGWARTSGSAAATSASFAVTSGQLLVVTSCGDGGGDPLTVTNSGTGFTWTQRATNGNNGRSAIFTAPVTTSQTITITRAASSEKWHGFVYVISGQHASPIGVSGASDSTTTPLNPAYTAGAAGSVTFVAGQDWNERGLPTSSNGTLTHFNLTGYTDGFAIRRTNAASGATSFNLAAGGGGPSFTYSYVEILPA